MATNKQNIEIALNSRYNGEGFKKLDGALRGASRGTRRYISSVNQALGGLESFDGVIGKATRSANLFWAAIAGGGVIGAVMSVIGIGIKLWEKYQERIEMVEDRIKRLDNVHKGYERRLEIYRQAAIRRAEEAKEAAKREVEAERKRLEGLAQSYERGVVYDKVVRRLNEAERRGSIEKEKDRIRNIEGLQEEAKAQRLATIELRENIKAKIEAARANVADKKRELLAAQNRVKAGGDTLQLDIAEKRLQIAKVELENVIAAGKREVAEYRRAIQEKQEAREHELEMIEIEADREIARQEEAEKRAEMRRRAEADMAEVREKSSEKIKKMEEEIAEARKRGVEWEKAAENARSQSAGNWMHQRRNQAKEQQRQDRQNDIWRKQAEDELKRYLKIINPSEGAKKRIDELRKYLNLQDDENNPNKQADKMETELAAYRGKVEKYLSEMTSALKNFGL